MGECNQNEITFKKNWTSLHRQETSLPFIQHVSFALPTVLCFHLTDLCDSIHVPCNGPSCNAVRHT